MEGKGESECGRAVDKEDIYLRHERTYRRDEKEEEEQGRRRREARIMQEKTNKKKVSGELENPVKTATSDEIERG